jgi:hypothetical protein
MKLLKGVKELFFCEREAGVAILEYPMRRGGRDTIKLNH